MSAGRLLTWGFPALWVVFLFTDLALWSGVRHGPYGVVALRSAQKEAPLALAYMQGGDALFGAAGLHAWSVDFATARLGHAYRELDAVPEAAMDILMREMPFGLRASHYGTLWLLPLWGLWLWRRPRQVHTIRRR